MKYESRAAEVPVGRAVTRPTPVVALIPDKAGYIPI